MPRKKAPAHHANAKLEDEIAESVLAGRVNLEFAVVRVAQAVLHQHEAFKSGVQGGEHSDRAIECAADAITLATGEKQDGADTSANDE